MAKSKKNQQQKLYDRLRAGGVRKSVAKDLTELPSRVKTGKAPKALREAVERLEGSVLEVRSHLSAGDRKSAAKKAARTRKAKASKRSAAARKGARKRAKK